jgi:ferritin-like metal-binding protein YciE
MQITGFKDMYIAELQELASMERQMGEALLRMSDVASHPSLKEALQHHREQTRTQMDRLEQVLRNHGSSPSVHTDQAVEALVAETEKMLKLVKGNDLRDAALIASAQKLEHYEMAAYGTAAALAGQLELRDDQRMLHDSLEEERQTDALLTTLAKGEVNQDAMLAA